MPDEPRLCRGPAIALFFEYGIDVEAADSVLFGQNEGGQFIFGGITPVVVSRKTLSVELINTFKAAFPDDPVGTCASLPHKTGLSVKNDIVLFQDKSFFHDTSGVNRFCQSCAAQNRA